MTASLSGHVRAYRHHPVRQPDGHGTGHRPEDCPAGSETAASGAGVATGQLHCGECRADKYDGHDSSDRLKLQL